MKRKNRPAIIRRSRERIERLLDLDWSQAEIARRIHVHPSQVSRWRRGLQVPSDETRKRLYQLARRHTESFPSDITRRVKRYIISHGELEEEPYFILPVGRGKIPSRYNGRVLFGRVVVNARIRFIDGVESFITTSIQQSLPPKTSLNNALIFDGLTADWLIQIGKISDSVKIMEYEVKKAVIHLVVTRDER